MTNHPSSERHVTLPDEAFPLMKCIRLYVLRVNGVVWALWAGDHKEYLQ